MNEQFKEQITYKAREFATAYTNRHFPNEPAFAFGHEGWEKFVVAMVELAGAHPDKGTSALAAPVVPAPVAQLSEPPASAALMRILKIVQDYVPPDGTPIEEAMSQIIACVDPWPDTGFNQFDDLLDDAAEWSGYVEVDTAPYGLKRHLKEVFEKYGITAAAPTTPNNTTAFPGTSKKNTP